jgi:hypothetical protein
LASFTVTPRSVVALAQQYGVPTQPIVANRMDATMRDPLGLVTAGNSIMRVAFANSGSSRVVDLVQSGTPLSVSVLSHVNQTPAVGRITGPKTVATALRAASSLTYSETNYGQYSPYLGAYGGWSVSACVGTAVVMASVTGYVGDQSSVSVVGFTPGSCTFDVVTTNSTYPVTATVTAANPNGLVAGVPTVTGQTLTSLTIGSTPPTKGSGSGYSVTYVIGATHTCGPATYVCTIGGLANGTKYPVTAIYHDSAGDTATASTSGMTLTNDPKKLLPGIPSVSGVTQTSLAVNSTPPSGGSGSGYYVSYLISSAVGCGPAVYACTIPGLTAATTYAITAVYRDSAGDMATASTSGTTQSLGQTAAICGTMRTPPAWYQLSSGSGTTAPAWTDMMSAIQANEEPAGVTTNNNVLYGYADGWPSSGVTPVKGAILMAQNTDCSVSIMWPTASQGEVGSDLIQQIVWVEPGAWRTNPTAAPYAPYIDTSNEQAGDFEGICYGGPLDGGNLSDEPSAASTFPSICQQPVGSGIVNGSVSVSVDGTVSTIGLTNGNMSYMHPRIEDVFVPNWRHTVLLILHPEASIQSLPIPMIGHEIFRLTGGTNDYWVDGVDWLTQNSNTSNPNVDLYGDATKFCLLLSCP